MIFTPHQLLLGYKIKGGEMGGKCGTKGVGNRLLSRYKFRKGNTILKWYKKTEQKSWKALICLTV